MRYALSLVFLLQAVMKALAVLRNVAVEALEALKVPVVPVVRVVPAVPAAQVEKVAMALEFR